MKKENGYTVIAQVARVIPLLRSADYCSPAICCNARGYLLFSHVEYYAFTSHMHAFLLYASVKNDNSKSMNESSSFSEAIKVYGEDGK